MNAAEDTLCINPRLQTSTEEEIIQVEECEATLSAPESIAVETSEPSQEVEEISKPSEIEENHVEDIKD